MKARMIFVTAMTFCGILCGFTTAAGQAVTFGTPTVIPVGPSAFGHGMAVATGDLNLDGKLDLVVANGFSNTLSVLLGTGGGMFEPQTDYATGIQPHSIAISDLNLDGKPDLVTANHAGRSLTILFGDGTGAFGGRTDLPTAPVGNGARVVVVADFNKDGKSDLAVNSDDVTNPAKINVFLGDGTGSFASAGIFLTGVSGVGLATADLDRDGNLDLVTANALPGTVSVLLGNGAGSFSTPTNFGAGSVSISIAIGDFNQDGNHDVAVANHGTDESPGGVSVLLGDGNGSFGPPAQFATSPRPVRIAVGDFNGDGKLDLVTANILSDSFSVLLGDGQGSFTVASFPTGTGTRPSNVAVGDLNRDGALDLVLAMDTGSVFVYLNSGISTITVGIDIKPGSHPNSINLHSAGVIPVAVLSTTEFDAPAAVDPDSLRLAGAAVNLIGKSRRFQCSRQDVNADGLLDLVCQFDATQFMIKPGQSIAVLEGRTFDGRLIRGEDTVRIVPQ